jgi:hypothetical protein
MLPPALSRALVIAGLSVGTWLFGMPVMTAAALAQGPPAAGKQAPAAPAYAPAGEAMTFRIANGAGPRGATRWVSATGQIQADTAAKFTAFSKANPIEGLPLVLDSSGGRVVAAMVLGRLVRAAKMQTTVGRTITADARDTVRSNDVRCASACVLVLAAGVSRSVPEDARVELHMFSVEIDADGNKARSDPTFRDIEQTQRMMARHAVYLAEMGVGARYLEIMTEASFRGPLRRMTRAEIVETALATVEPRAVTTPVGPRWILSPASAPPQLIRTSRLMENERLALNHELVLECDSVRGFYWVTYRQQLERLAAPRGGAPPVALQTARLETGGWDFYFRAPANRALGINAAGGDLWMRRSVPRKVFDDSVQNSRLDITLSTTGRPDRNANLFDPTLKAMLPEFAGRCDARRGLVSVGPHPLR